MNPKRSTIIRLCIVAAAPWAWASHAQTSDRTLRVGLIAFGNSGLSANLQRALVDGLRQQGYIEGKNLVIEARYADGRPERVPELAAQLAAAKPDVVVTTCTPSTRAMRNATQTIPLVMATVSDPVGQGLIASYRRPGGNITGLASRFEDLAPKMLQLLHETVPSASSVAVFLNPKTLVHQTFFEQMDAASKPLNIRLRRFDVGVQTDMNALFDELARERISSVIVLPDDPMMFYLRRRVIELAGRQRLPTFFGVREAVEDGALMSYGEALREGYFRAAYYVNKIAKGAKPSELPVEQPNKFELVVNLKTAKALGVTVPQSILLRADKVIE